MCPISTERSIQLKQVTVGRRREISINGICLACSDVSFLFGSVQCIGANYRGVHHMGNEAEIFVIAILGEIAILGGS